MKNRAMSAPYSSISACGSTPLFLDFDMVPMPPRFDGLAISRSTAPVRLPLSSNFHLDVRGVVIQMTRRGGFAFRKKISLSTMPCASSS